MDDNFEPLSWKLETFFLPGVAGNLFAIYVPPDRAFTQGKSVLIVPPFAEEMTRSRRMVSFQARRLSSVGVGTLIVDLFGTGDSGGEFKDARWNIWRSDIGTAVDWLSNERGNQVSLLGIRLGALLAMDFVQQGGDINVEKMIFWKPSLSGEENLREFLFQRVLAGMMEKATSRVTFKTLRERLHNGELVESAGYELSHLLADEIGKLHLGQLGTKKSAPIHWIELCASSKDESKLVGQEIVDDWVENNIDTTRYTLNGFPFWAKTDVNVVNDLLDLTTKILGEN